MYTTFFISAYISCIELASFSVFYGEFEEAKLIVRFTGEGDELRGLLILKAFEAVFVKLIFSTLLVLKRFS